METALTVIMVGVGGLCAALAYVAAGTKIRHFLHVGTPKHTARLPLVWEY